MIICICLNYRTADLVRDINKGKTIKGIIKDVGIDKRCKKCCKFIKEEYKNIKSTKN